MKVVFLGTPEFALNSLRNLVNSKHQVIAVVTQPDKEAGRGKKLIAPAVKVFAQECGIPVYQFKKIGRDGVEELKKLKPDIMITVAYGQLLTKAVLEIPKFGVINVHGSLLPKYRGASPIQSAIMRGETVTGITIMQTDIGLDDGDILSSETLEILPTETAGELAIRLSKLGADLLLKTLDDIQNGNVKHTKQDNGSATFTTKIKKSDCIINWNKSAKQINSLIRGANPDPIASTAIGGEIIKIYRGEVVVPNFDVRDFQNGEILPSSSAKAGIFVKCGNNALNILSAQLPNGKVLTGKQIMCGRKLKVGDIFDQNVRVEE